MTSQDNDERIRKAAKRTTPPLPPEVRKRALWAAMVAMRRRSPLRTALFVVLMLLTLGAAGFALVRWLLLSGALALSGVGVCACD